MTVGLPVSSNVVYSHVAQSYAYVEVTMLAQESISLTVCIKSEQVTGYRLDWKDYRGNNQNKMLYTLPEALQEFSDFTTEPTEDDREEEPPTEEQILLMLSAIEQERQAERRSEEALYKYEMSSY